MRTDPLTTEHDAPECDWVDARLDAYVDGELAVDESDCVERHLATCETCENVARGLTDVKDALAGLPAFSCPERVLEAVRREATANDILRSPGHWRRVTAYAAALAACLLVGFGAWSIRGAYERHQAELRRERVELALAELQTTLRRRASDVGREAFEHGVAKPTRTVVTAVRDSPLGKWGATVASLVTPTNRQEADAT